MNAAAKARQTSSSSRVRSLPPDSSSISTEAIQASVEVLTDEESADLDNLDEFEDLLKDIEEGVTNETRSWWKATIAAAKLRHHKGWKNSKKNSNCKNFVDYCAFKFGWEQSTAYDYAFYGAFLIRLESFGVPRELWPAQRSHIAAIRKLKEEEQPIVWQQLASSSESRLTAETIKVAVDEYLDQSESGASFEELQARYAALPNTRLLKVKNGRFNYAIEQSGRTQSLHSLKEVEAAFEGCKERAEYHAAANASGTGAAAKQFDFSNVDRAKLNPTIAPTDETEDSIAPADVETFDADSDEDIEGAEVAEYIEETIELPLVESVENSQVEAIGIAEEESDEEYASPSFDPYLIFESLLNRVNSFYSLGWNEKKVHNTANEFCDFLKQKTGVDV